MANELHDNVKFGKQQTINFHENWHQIDGSQQYLKGHTHTHTYGQWADGKQTNPVEDKDNKKKGNWSGNGSIACQERLWLDILYNRSKQQQEQEVGQTQSNVAQFEWHVSTERQKVKKKNAHCSEKIYIYLYTFLSTATIQYCQSLLHLSMYKTHAYTSFFFWHRTLGSRETLRVISSVQLRSFPKRKPDKCPLWDPCPQCLASGFTSNQDANHCGAIKQKTQVV